MGSVNKKHKEETIRNLKLMFNWRVSLTIFVGLAAFVLGFIFDNGMYGALGAVVLYSVLDYVGYHYGIKTGIELVYDRNHPLTIKVTTAYRILQHTIQILLWSIVLVGFGFEFVVWSLLLFFTGFCDILYHAVANITMCPKDWRWADWTMIGWSWRKDPISGRGHIPNVAFYIQFFVGLGLFILGFYWRYGWTL